MGFEHPVRLLHDLVSKSSITASGVNVASVSQLLTKL